MADFVYIMSYSSSIGIDTDFLNIETDIEEETIEFFIREEIEVLEDSE